MKNFLCLAFCVLIFFLTPTRHTFCFEERFENIYPGLPHKIELSIDIIECKRLFNVARDKFNQNFDPETLSNILSSLSQGRLEVLTPEIRVYLKAQRKNGTILRDAFDLFHASHNPPAVFEQFLDVFGSLNDAILSGVSKEISRSAYDLQNSFDFLEILQTLTYFEPSTKASFDCYILGLMKTLKDLSSHTQLSADKFHEMRWTLKKFLNLFTLLIQIDSNSTYPAIQRHLDSLNTHMGLIHDEVVMADLLGKRDYQTQIVQVPLFIKSGILDFITHLEQMTAFE
jgi:hypothetical protein